MKSRFTSGFTIVELLIVIVVIAILAAIVIVAYNGAQTRAKASAITAGLKSAEKAFRLYAIDMSYDVWPADSAMIAGVSANPTIPQFITNTSFKNYMNKAPTVSGISTSSWFYDNDSDTRTNCGSRYNGTNIIIIGVPQDVATSIDTSQDDGNDNCGKVRYDTTNQYFFYSLSYDANL